MKKFTQRTSTALVIASLTACGNGEQSANDEIFDNAAFLTVVRSDELLENDNPDSDEQDIDA